jgi:hypothetical protein
MKKPNVIAILGIVGGIIAIIGAAVASANYIGDIKATTTIQGERIANVEDDVNEFKDAINQIIDIANSARNDAAATRAYTEFIITRYGANPRALWNDSTSTPTETFKFASTTQ